MRDLSSDPGEAARDDILKARAAALAAPSTASEEDGATLSYLAFAIGDERYGIEAHYVREVLEIERVTRVPGTPMLIAGIFSLRGEIVSAIDAAQLFSIRSETQPAFMIVLRSDAMQFGLHVRLVEGVRSVRPQDVQPAFATLSETTQRYLKGFTPDNVALIDGAVLLADPELTVNTE